MKAARWIRGLLWLATLLATATPAWAQPDELPSEPMLRINAPSHIGALRGIATDAAEQFAVTSSDDKTVRVWSLPDGTLQRVIWLPSGDGDVGKARAMALSPDGRTIAVSGWTSPTGLNENLDTLWTWREVCAEVGPSFRALDHERRALSGGNAGLRHIRRNRVRVTNGERFGREARPHSSSTLLELTAPPNSQVVYTRASAIKDATSSALVGLRRTRILLRAKTPVCRAEIG